ncbi:hypothetical protein Syun_019352 [Stephania yunnanensis]|uniref:Uncharacterized protein n=1 Tax=Stephania yunnanensis TaxID=152371 RepID=A0AAP0NXX6_9MAGN
MEVGSGSRDYEIEISSPQSTCLSPNQSGDGRPPPPRGGGASIMRPPFIDLAESTERLGSQAVICETFVESPKGAIQSVPSKKDGCFAAATTIDLGLRTYRHQSRV